MSNTTSIIDADLSLSFTPEVLSGLQGFLFPFYCQQRSKC